MKKIVVNSNFADALTGERIPPGSEVIDTELPNKPFPYSKNGKTLFLKEDTIVWLAEQAGFVVTRGNARNSGNTEVVDGKDVGVGNGEGEVGKPKVGGRKKPAGSADGDVKGK